MKMIIAKIAKKHNRFSYFILCFSDYFCFLTLKLIAALLFFVILA